METKSSWLVLLLGVILTVGSSQATKACPENLIKATKYPVIQMCKKQTTSGATALYLDAFLETTSTTCDCHLHATQPSTIGISPVRLPERDCGSTLTIHTPRKLRYTCADDDQSGYEPRQINITQENNLIQIQTRNASKTATYCLYIYSIGGGGTLSLECFPPANDSVTSSTHTEDKTKTTLLRSTTTHSPSTAPMTSGKVGVTLSPSSPEVDKSETTEQTDSEVRTDRQSDAEPFPVAAVVGGIVATALVFAVVVVVVVIFIRKKRTKGNVNTDNTGDYVNANFDVGDVGVNHLNTDNSVNPHDTEAIANNTYERLQHGGVHYVNTPSSANNTYERLQHDGVQYANTAPSADEDHVYLGMQNQHT